MDYSTFSPAVSTRNNSLLRLLGIVVVCLFSANGAWGATPYVMSRGNYSENFSNMETWTNNFTSGTGASCWASVGIIGSGTSVTSGVRTTKSSTTFVSGAEGGIQKGTPAMIFLSTGTTSTPEAVAVDLLLNFTDCNAGTLSFDWAALDNSKGTRPTSLKVFWSIDEISFTQITQTQVTNKISPSIGSITTIALPTQFNNCPSAKLRFYNHAGLVSGSGNRDKMQIDNVKVTSTASTSDPTIFTATTSSTTQIDLSATANVNSDNIVVIYNETGTFTTPTNGSVPTATGTILAGSNGTIVYAGASADLVNHINLTSDTTYYYKAFSYNGTNTYSTGIIANATTAKIEPTNQPSSITVQTTVTSTSIPLTWLAAVAGSQAPDGYLVKLSTDAVSDPVDGIDPEVGSSAISNGTAVYKATTDASFSNALAGTMYNIKIYSYTNSGTFIDFNTNSVPTFLVATPPNPANSGSIIATGTTTADITWALENDYDITNHSTLVFVKATSSINSGTPTNAPSTYTSNSAFSSGTVYQVDPLAKCVYKGDGTSVSITGLSANTIYYVLIYTVVDATNSDLKNSYSAFASASGRSNLLAPTATAATGISSTGFTANWGLVTEAVSYQLDVYTKVNEGSTFSILSENFTKFTKGTMNSGANSTDVSTSLNTYTQNTGWTGSKIYEAGGSIKVGTANDLGYITTPVIDLSANSGAFKLSFKSMAWDSNNTSLKIFLNNVLAFTVEGLSNDANYTLAPLSIDLTGGTAKSSIRFEGNGSTLSRFFLEDLVISQSEGLSLMPISGSPFTGITQTSKSLSGLDANTIYYYTVKVSNGINTSAASNEIKDKYLTTTKGSANMNSTSAWSDGQVPKSGAYIIVNNDLTITQDANVSSLTINPRGKLTLNAATTLTATTLNLNSDANGTATYIDNGITKVTTANVQQHLTADRNWYVSSPVKAANVGSLSTASSVVWWDETNGNWAAAPSDSTLHPLRGYISVSTKATQAITFTSALNTGPQTISLSRHIGVPKEGFNLVGNPYPSYLSWTSAIATAANALPTIWYRTHVGSAYAFYTYNAEGSVGVPAGTTGVIPPMQAFWVRANAEGGTLTFDNSMRSHGNGGSNLLKVKSVQNTTDPKVLRLQVSNGTNSDEAVLYFNPNASDSFDAYDSPKMSNGSSSIPEIYTLAGDEELVINGMNAFTLNTEMPLGFRPGRANSFSIKATEIRNFESDIRLILKDNQENKETDITDAPYDFNSDSITTASRFSLILRSAGVTTDLDNTDMKRIVISRNANNQITIQGSTLSTQGSVTLYNAMGQRVAAKHLSGILTIMDAPLPVGVYMVRVTNAGQTTTRKVILD